jgi:protein-tyrosine kinase
MLLLELLDTRIRGRRQVVSLVGAPPLAIIPWVAEEEKPRRFAFWRRSPPARPRPAHEAQAMVERIKRAMELARQERESAAGQPAGLAREASPAHPGSNSAARRPAAGRGGSFPARPRCGRGTGEQGDVSRTIGVSEKTLQESRLLLPGMVGDAAHGFRLLRTQVLQRMRQRGWNTMAILSPGPDEGKTFTAINLAIAIAADPDSTALLVDLDLRFPRLYRRLGFLPTVGVEDCLRGEAQLSDAIVAVEGYPA